MTNPSHILIARNSRGTHNPSASLSSPTETHAAAAGIFRSSGSPPWFLEGVDTDDVVSELSIDDSEDPIDVDQTFTKSFEFPGTVKIVVEKTTFWAHKEVLYFASPFFQAALSGDWAETGRPASMSSVITISQPPTIPGDKRHSDLPTEMTFAPMDPDIDPDDLDVDPDINESSETEAETSDSSPNTPKKDTEKVKVREDGAKSPEEKESARKESLDRLQGGTLSPKVEATMPPEIEAVPGPSNVAKEKLKGKSDTVRLSWKKGTAEAAVRRRKKINGPDAVIVLKEEKAMIFHDFLRYVYPSMECTITWNNVEGLMNIAHKLCVHGLQQKCLTFLLTHAAGRPIKAMRIAELFEEEELYRESSRFVLDNPGGWTEQEMSALSHETLLKLEKRRTWFLERVLKLGLFQIAREYECCPTCPDPSLCARLLEDKWRQAYAAVFRFGPCQPSMVFRYLRTLEGVSPPLALSHLACQTTAKAFVATRKSSPSFLHLSRAQRLSGVCICVLWLYFASLRGCIFVDVQVFDRMFSLGIRGSGTDTAPLGARVAAVAGVASTTGPRRHFLYCSLKPEVPVQPRSARNAATSQSFS